MHILLVLGLLGPMTQTEIGKINEGMTSHQLIEVMGEPIAITKGWDMAESKPNKIYTFKSAKCRGFTEICSLVIKRDRVQEYLDIKPEYLASK